MAAVPRGGEAFEADCRREEEKSRGIGVVSSSARGGREEVYGKDGGGGVEEKKRKREREVR
jgi:hypothetical protein